MHKVFIVGFFSLLLQASLCGQTNRWQQRVEYQMDIDFNPHNHRFAGKQRLTYYNNSPDTLYKVFYHLYFNAFQPGSAMDIRTRTIPDPDRRMAGKISVLKPDEIGYQHINQLEQNGKRTVYHTEGTILEVTLADPLLPGQKTRLDMEFEAQVPVQIRRSGRNNAERIDYSMAQWYPKLCEYDEQGWHANPYIAREFYGVWGDFDVKITIDSNYVVAGTGYLQNPQEIGHGYATEGMKVKRTSKRLTWHFLAPNVHDFVWAADPDYEHITYNRKDGLALHFFYVPGDRTQAWPLMPAVLDKAFDYINATFGPYAYKQYSFIQAGDGGMEYPMATLITGRRPLESLVGVALHELMHSWYQMMLGNNESLYAWMDEGFADYSQNRVINYLKEQKLLSGQPRPFIFAGNYNSYVDFAQSGYEEPMSTHADFFQTNSAYSTASYTKGLVFLNQLEYIIGKQAFDKGLLRYFYDWKFKHPNENDFIRVMEKVSGLELDWYKELFVHTTHTIDYKVVRIEGDENHTDILLQRIGYLPMPLDVTIHFADGSSAIYNIPLDIMRGSKPAEQEKGAYQVLPDWQWVNPEYKMTIGMPLVEVSEVLIDPSRRLADINPADNVMKSTP